jgi:phospholipid/cholesterol/gamma-HCH transport system permease protein
MIGPVARAQRWFEDGCLGAGYTIGLVTRGFTFLARASRKRAEIGAQLALCTLGSMPVVFITALFTGMIISLQTGNTLRDWGQESLLGYIVSVSMCREMGPVFTCLTLAGLVGSTYAAELGTMKVSEEVDALEVMSIDPVYFLVMPRLISLALASFVLTVYANAIGILGGALVAQAKFNVDVSIFLENGRDALKTKDLWGGLLKASVFGTTIAGVSCAQGLRASGGPAGVGLATLRAVVVSFILILVFDYLLTWAIW